MLFRIALPTDFTEMAELIAKQNNREECHSLHCEQSEQNVLKELKDYATRKEYAFVLAFENQKLVGLLGGDSTFPVDEIWLWGPFILSPNWNQLANSLFDELLKCFPDTKKLTTFSNLKNQQARDFFKAHGFAEKKEFTHQYQCEKAEVASQEVTSEDGIVEFERSYLKDLNALHRSAFPNAYYSIDEMLGLISPDHKIWIKLDEYGNFCAYLFGMKTPNEEGFVHFLAVKHEHRKKGIGSQLLRKAQRFYFDEKGLESISLTVAEANNARRLYQKNGFKLQYTGVGARKAL